MPILLALLVGPDIPAERGTVMVGRHPDCDVQLASRRVSRRHCIIATERGDVVVRDLRSTNGTWINGRCVASGRIRAGEEVAIADVRYRLEEAPTPSEVVVDLPNGPGEGLRFATPNEI